MIIVIYKGWPIRDDLRALRDLKRWPRAEEKLGKKTIKIVSKQGNDCRNHKKIRDDYIF